MTKQTHPDTPRPVPTPQVSPEASFTGFDLNPPDGIQSAASSIEKLKLNHARIKMMIGEKVTELFAYINLATIALTQYEKYGDWRSIGILVAAAIAILVSLSSPIALAAFSNIDDKEKRKHARHIHTAVTSTLLVMMFITVTILK